MEVICLVQKDVNFFVCKYLSKEPKFSIYKMNRLSVSNKILNVISRLEIVTKLNILRFTVYFPFLYTNRITLR